MDLSYDPPEQFRSALDQLHDTGDEGSRQRRISAPTTTCRA